MNYTHSEKTQRRWSVGKAVDTATILLKERHRVDSLCTNALDRYGRDLAALLTLPEFNDLVERLVDDTLYHL